MVDVSGSQDKEEICIKLQQYQPLSQFIKVRKRWGMNSGGNGCKSFSKFDNFYTLSKCILWPSAWFVESWKPFFRQMPQIFNTCLGNQNEIVVKPYKSLWVKLMIVAAWANVSRCRLTKLNLTRRLLDFLSQLIVPWGKGSRVSSISNDVGARHYLNF